MANSTSPAIPADVERKMDEAIARYPSDHRRSAAMPLLHLWQEHFGFISDEAVVWSAEKLCLLPSNILELTNLYPLFREKPAANTHIRLSRTPHDFQKHRTLGLDYGYQLLPAGWRI